MPKQTIEVEVPEGWKVAGKAQKHAVMPGPDSEDQRGSIACHVILEKVLQYRDVTAADVGKLIRMRGSPSANRYFIGFDRQGEVVYEMDDKLWKAPANNFDILDDGPVKEKREPREWWIHKTPNGLTGEMYLCKQCWIKAGKQQIHVREVLS